MLRFSSMKIRKAIGVLPIPSLLILGFAIAMLTFSIVAQNSGLFASATSAEETTEDGEQSFITIYDGEEKTTLRSGATTVRELLARANITYGEYDTVEPGLDEDINSEYFNINIIVLARLWLLIIILKSTFVLPQPSLKPLWLTLDLNYSMPMRSKLSLITISSKAVWRRLIKLSMQKQLNSIAYGTKTTYDYSLAYGTKKVTTKGQKGKKTVTYEINMRNGKEISRRVLSSIVTKKPVDEQVKVGMKVDLPAGTHNEWMARAGISSSDYGYVNYIIERESHWNPHWALW